MNDRKDTSSARPNDTYFRTFSLHLGTPRQPQHRTSRPVRVSIASLSNRLLVDAAKAMHQDMGHDWTLERLARIAAMRRSALPRNSNGCGADPARISDAMAIAQGSVVDQTRRTFSRTDSSKCRLSIRSGIQQKVRAGNRRHTRPVPEKLCREGISRRQVGRRSQTPIVQ